MFRNHIRSLDKTFIPELETNMDSKAQIFIQNITELEFRMDYVIACIFDFETLFTHDVKILDLNKLKLIVYYNHMSRNNKTTDFFHIRDRNDNPLRQIGSKNDIRVRKKL
jgi:hypothetical protein